MRSRSKRLSFPGAFACLVSWALACPASAGKDYCSDTAKLQFEACRSEVKDDGFTGKAICLNVADEDARDECSSELKEAIKEGKELCRAQLHARRDLCDLLGGGRYDPDFDPALFDDDFANLTQPNPYYPLAIGNVWDFEAADETNRVEVLDKTKLIDGVTCIVVNDLVEGEDSMENTNDWLGQRKDGTVDYCGEEVRDLELFEGDDPQEFELVAIDGSFKAGRDGDASGTLFPGAPVVGMTFRQEWSAGNAEDAATILSTTYGYGTHPDLDAHVPQALADLLCNHDCVVTAEFTPIDPGVLEYKYYAYGIGGFLEVNLETGERNQLVDCNFDPRCALLPAP